MSGPSPLHLLLVDSDRAYAERLASFLALCGHHLVVEHTPEAGLTRAQEEAFDVLLLDLRMPRIDGLAFIRRLPADARPELIVVSEEVTVRSAIEAMKLGAFDCVPKTDDLESLDFLIRKAGEARRRSRDLQLLSRRIQHHTLPVEIISRSACMAEVLDVLQRVATSNVSVLLTGESGTGKDLLARLLHHQSLRSGAPFVDVNCAALAESMLEAELFGHEKGSFTGATTTRPGLAEAADGGTLFLDEVTEMSPSLQAKLLRMTEDHTLYRVGGRQRIRVDVRIVAATNRNVRKEIAAGRVREDLYYRLAGVELMVPPLRERPEDVGLLAEHYLQAAARQCGRGPTSLTDQALLALRSYRWPGNVRELRNMMQRMALLVRGDVLDVTHLPADVLDPPRYTASDASPELPLKDLERRQIQRVLDEEGWHHGRAAKRLGLPLRTLYRRIKHYTLTRTNAFGDPLPLALPGRLASASAEDDRP
ncbi:MAG: sigma-54 dependent transcriptional regulator [Vicinamibacteria bacterium]